MPPRARGLRGCDVRRPTVVGDTIYVQCEVIEAREASNPGRGLVCTLNTVTNHAEETVLVYRPLRLMRRRPPGQESGEGQPRTA